MNEYVVYLRLFITGLPHILIRRLQLHVLFLLVNANNQQQYIVDVKVI